VEEREWIGAKAETPESQKYVGMSRDDALEAADTAGVKAVRVIEGTQHLTDDFRSDRLNILVADGYVRRAPHSSEACTCPTSPDRWDASW
jgi:hypothetical protein